jgi:hypothetical protein
MAAAPASVGMAFELGVVSPELALVDSDLATRARALIPDVQNAPAVTALPVVSELPVAPERPTPAMSASRRKPRVFPVSFPDNGSFVEGRTASDTLQHLGERAPKGDDPGSTLSSRTHFRRLTTLVPTSSAAVATTLLVFQFYLSAGTL